MRLKWLVLVVLIVVLINFHKIFANENILACTFPNKTDQILLKNCAFLGAASQLKIKKSIFKKIKFNEKGLAEGTISGHGCFWLNKEGALRKTLCFDNGSDYFEDGYARYINSSGYFGYMNQKLKVVIPAQYSFAFPFVRGLAKVCMGCKSVQLQDREHSLVSGGSWMIIDKKNKVIKKCASAKDFNSCI